MLDSNVATGDSLAEGRGTFSITTRIETTVEPYVALFAVLLFWYRKTVTIEVTNNSDTSHADITIRLTGSAGGQGCPEIAETYIIPLIGPRDTDTRTFSYKRKQDCPYSLSGEVVSYR